MGCVMLVVGLDARSLLYEAVSYLIELETCIGIPEERYLYAVSTYLLPRWT